MKETRKRRFWIYCILAAAAIVAPPLLLQIPSLEVLVARWLNFTDNPDYKIAYIETVGNAVGVFVSVLGALKIEQYQIRHNEEKKRREYATRLYAELERCFNILSDIHQETVLNHFGEFCHIEKADFRSLCEKYAIAALKHPLDLDQGYIPMLDTLYGHIDAGTWKDLRKCFSRLSVIDQAFQTGDPNRIQEIMIPYINCFIDLQGNGRIYGNIQQYMDNLRQYLK